MKVKEALEMLRSVIEFIEDFFSVTWKMIAFLITIAVSYCAGFSYGVPGIIACYSWVFALAIIEWLRQNYWIGKPKDGYTTSEARKKKLLDDIEKERMKTKRK